MCSFHLALIDRGAMSDGKLWVSKFPSRSFETDFSDEVVDQKLEAVWPQLSIGTHQYALLTSFIQFETNLHGL